MPYDFTGKTALVTGATSGIGRAAAKKLAAGGAYVIVSGRDAQRGDETVSALRAAGGKAEFIPADLTDIGGVRALASAALQAGGGRVDILINNAGMFPFAPTPRVAETEFDTVFAVNVKAPFYLVAELAPKMAEHGSGAIVNVTTQAASYGQPMLPLYSSSKAALQLLTKAWAAEFGPAGVRVNAVSPGATRTEGTQAMAGSLAEEAAKIPAGVVATPEQIADGLVFLASEQASHIHGVVLPVDGGRLAV